MIINLVVCFPCGVREAFISSIICGEPRKQLLRGYEYGMPSSAHARDEYGLDLTPGPILTQGKVGILWWRLGPAGGCVFVDQRTFTAASCRRDGAVLRPAAQAHGWLVIDVVGGTRQQAAAD